MFKNALMIGAVGIFAIAASLPTAQAATDYGLTISQGTCTGGNSSCSALATNAATFGTTISTGTWTSTLAGGGLNFSVPTGGTDTVQTFLNSGTGSYVGTNTPLGQTLSTSGLGTQTEFVFTGTLAVPSSITITHDDGFAFYLGSVLNSGSQPNPTTPITTTITSGSGAFTLYYVSSNGLPETLDFTVSPIPLPATVWLFGAGLGGLALLTRRRRNSGLALTA